MGAVLRQPIRGSIGDMSRAPKESRSRSRTLTESSKQQDEITPLSSDNPLLGLGSSGNLDLPFAERLDALRSTSVTFKKKKRFLVLDSTRLHLLKSAEDTKPPFLTIGLQLCKARPSVRDPLTFEVLTSSEHYHFTLEKEMSGGNPHEWIQDIQKVCDRLVLNTIGGEKKGNLLDRSYSMLISADDARKAAGMELKEDTSELTENQRRVMEIAIRPGNRNCADCGAPQPEWASTNLGIFVCIDCAGPHRSFGSHISKMRGVKLDRWDQPELLTRLDQVGNVASNAIFEATIPADFPLARPTSATAPRERLEWITLKYVDRRFTANWTPPTEEEIAARDPEHARRKAQEKRLEELKNAAADIRKRDNKQMLLKLLQEDASFRHEVRLLLLQDVDLDALKREIDAMKASAPSDQTPDSSTHAPASLPEPAVPEIETKPSEVETEPAPVDTRQTQEEAESERPSEAQETLPSSRTPSDGQDGQTEQEPESVAAEEPTSQNVDHIQEKEEDQEKGGEETEIQAESKTEIEPEPKTETETETVETEETEEAIDPLPTPQSPDEEESVDATS